PQGLHLPLFQLVHQPPAGFPDFSQVFINNLTVYHQLHRHFGFFLRLREALGRQLLVFRFSHHRKTPVIFQNGVLNLGDVKHVLFPEKLHDLVDVKTAFAQVVLQNLSILDDDDRIPFQQLLGPTAFQGEIGHQKGETSEEDQPEKVKTGFRIDIGGQCGGDGTEGDAVDIFEISQFGDLLFSQDDRQHQNGAEGEERLEKDMKVCQWLSHPLP